MEGGGAVGREGMLNLLLVEVRTVTGKYFVLRLVGSKQ